jgi:hypothetical protein
MPNAARLFAALIFAATGAGVAHVLDLPQLGWTVWTGCGAVVGWVVMGALTGRGYQASAGFGLRTSVTVAFWALLILSTREMIRRAYLRQYDDPFEAIVGIFEIILIDGRAIIAAEPLAVLVVGGLVGGVLAEFAGRRWR